MNFHVGDSVEVCSREDGFQGSYFTAKIISRNTDGTFKVKYESLLTDDENGQLIEIVKALELRPVPPEIRVSGLNMFEKVDAFDLDGWWTGIISGKNSNGKYYVCFGCSGDEYEYPFSALRVHMEFEGGRWILSRKMGV